MVKQKDFAMQTHALFELEESLNRGKPLGIDESLALVNEIWRLPELPSVERLLNLCRVVQL